MEHKADKKSEALILVEKMEASISAWRAETVNPDFKILKLQEEIKRLKALVKLAWDAGYNFNSSSNEMSSTGFARFEKENNLLSH